MKTLGRTLFAGLALPTALLLPLGCGDSAEAHNLRREAGETLDATKAYTAKEIEDMTNQLQDRWRDLQTDLTKLKAEASARGASAKANLTKVIADVEAKAAEAKSKLSSVGAAGKGEAGESLTHLEKAYDSAKAAVQEAWNELRK
jgi:leucyl aminopeptidase (aminopeptidase T)